MTRDARKRWLTRITLVALTGLIGLGMWLPWGTPPRPADAPGPEDSAGPAAAPGPADGQVADVTRRFVFHATGPLGPPARDASLVVLEFLSDQPEWRTQVVRYDFKNGRVQPPEVLWEGSSHRFGSVDRIIEKRYLVSESGSVIDLQEKTLIHEGAGSLVEVRGDRVVSGVYNSSKSAMERHVAFNLRARAIEKLTDREVEEFAQRDALWGERSPDGMKSVYASPYSLKLYQVGQPPKELGTFNVGKFPMILLSSGLWLDNDRFLTQDGDGNLFTVGTDGVRVPVVRVPVKEQDAFLLSFRRDADGRIIYTCGREQFLINTEAKTWERCEWTSLGHGFEESSDDRQRYVYRYKGTEILRSPFWTRRGPNALVTESYIAVCVGGSVCVWYAGTGEWVSLGKFASEIVGWIK